MGLPGKSKTITVEPIQVPEPVKQPVKEPVPTKQPSKIARAVEALAAEWEEAK